MGYINKCLPFVGKYSLIVSEGVESGVHVERRRVIYYHQESLIICLSEGARLDIHGFFGRNVFLEGEDIFPF